MKKLISLVAAALLSSAAFTQIRAGVLKGPSGIPMAYQMENVHELEGQKIQYEVFSQANMLLPKLIKGEIDIGFLPPNVAAKVYNAGNGKIVCAAVSGNGMLYLLTKDSSIKSLADLKGRELSVAVAGAGATPEYMFRYLLEKNNVREGSFPNSLYLNMSIPTADIAAALISGQVQCALVPEPFATVACTKDKSVIRAVDIQKEFASAGGSKTFPMTLIVVNADYLKNHEKEVEAFLSEYKKASDWTVKNPGEAGKLVQKHELGLNAAVVEKAVPSCAFVFERGKDAQKRIEELLNIFLTFDSTSIGGKFPDKGFYY